MGMVSKLVILESEDFLQSAFKSSKNFKVRQRIQSLLLLKQKKFKRQVDLAAYLYHLNFDFTVLMFKLVNA